MSQLRQLAGQTAIYGVSSVLGRVLNYLLVPLYTSVFSPGAYGVVTELYAYVAFLNVLYTYGFETAYFRFASQSANREKYFRIAQTSLVLSSIVFSLMLMLLSDSIAVWLEYPEHGNLIRWLALILAIDAVVAVPFARLRLEGKGVRFAIFKLSNISINIGLNLFFLVFCPWWIASHDSTLIAKLYDPSMGVGYVFLANLLANATYLLFFRRDFGSFRFRLDREWTVMFLYAAPLMVMGFAGVTNEMLSRALLKYLLPEGYYPGLSNLEVLGIFGACYKLSVFMTLAVQAFKYAFEPFFFSRSAGPGSPELFARVMHGFIVFGSLAWLAVSVFLPVIAPVFLSRDIYLTGLDIVPWLLGGGLFLGIYFNLSVWYKLTDKTYYGAWITVAGACLTILLNVTLIPVVGYMGSAITTFLSYLVMVIISYYLGQRQYFIPYRLASGLFYIIIAGLSILAFYFWGFHQQYKYFIATGLIILYCFIVWLLDLRRGNSNSLK